jgi:hypothetical protein
MYIRGANSASYVLLSFPFFLTQPLYSYLCFLVLYLFLSLSLRPIAVSVFVSRPCRPIVAHAFVPCISSVPTDRRTRLRTLYFVRADRSSHTPSSAVPRPPCRPPYRRPSSSVHRAVHRTVVHRPPSTVPSVVPSPVVLRPSYHPSTEPCTCEVHLTVEPWDPSVHCPYSRLRRLCSQPSTRPSLLQCRDSSASPMKDGRPSRPNPPPTWNT